MNKLRGFNYPWHLAHQYELSKLPFVEWDYLRQYKRPYSEHARGDFMEGKWVPYYEPGKYDFALLHLDQQCIEDGIMKRGKGRLYVEMNELIQDVPKIVIMHGTTYYPEKFSKDEVIERVKELVGDNYMVTNSFQCAEDFGFGHPIWHGMDSEEWWTDTKEIRAATFISAGGLDKYYDRSFFEAIRDELLDRGIQHIHISVDWRARDWTDYRNFLAKTLVYINPTFDSPMPRSRTEAMLSGCCVLTTPHQDADQFIEDGVNGFLIPRNPKEVADRVEWCYKNYAEAVAIGQKARETATETFSLEKYYGNWKKVLEEVTGKSL